MSKDTLSCTLFNPTTQKPLWSHTVPISPVAVVSGRGAAIVVLSQF
ncbi:MAG TPA: hypothetical protein VF600_08985 [Abditibacteriaceae bacterium]